ncbi:MAG: molybdenum cofactor biosynthesis protein MoaE [Verrucomicrobiota bacterium]
MNRSLLITTDPIDEAALIAVRSLSAGMGAVVAFSGVVRGREGDASIAALDYTCFVPMAEHQFHRLFDRLAGRGTIESVRLVHRIGRVAVGEASLWVEVVAAHRAEAFEACQWLIDEMKRVVPIWKKAVPASAPDEPSAPAGPAPAPVPSTPSDPNPAP